MSQKIKAPNEKNNGFLWAIIALVVAVIVAIVAIVFIGQNKVTQERKINVESVNFGLSVEGNSIVLKAKDVKENAPVVEIFEDYSCHYCAELNAADHEQVKDAVEKGDLVVRYQMLTFLDRSDNGPSLRGAATALAVAKSGNVDAYWSVHDYLMENQETVVTTWKWDDYRTLLTDAGVDGSVVDSLENEDHLKATRDIADKNSKDLEGRVGQISSPQVFVNGENYQLKKGEDGKLASWVPDVVKS